MNREECSHLIAERDELKRLLADIPQEDVLDRASFQSRLESVEQQLQTSDVKQHQPAKARLTFRGKPVVGSHGIFAEFGMTASKAFADAVSSMAASFTRTLAPTGPIPDRGHYQLLITGTALGSFGFEFEEQGDAEPAFGDQTVLGIALKSTQDILSGSLLSDDELADAANGADPRVIENIRTFLQTMISADAVCNVTVRDRSVQFKDVGEVTRSWARLGKDNFHEGPVTREGVFLGVLPLRRTFEFRISGTDEPISGKISQSVDADELNRHLSHRARITLIETRVGNGRPRYVLDNAVVWLS